MTKKPLGFEPGDLLLVLMNGVERPVLVKKILPNLDITYADLLNPAPGEDKCIQICSAEGLKNLYRPFKESYQYLNFPATLLRFQANSNNHYVELLKFEKPPEEHCEFVVHEVKCNKDGDPIVGRCWESKSELEMLRVWREVCSGHPPMSAAWDDEWLC
jgi:hypothetical protein